MRNSFNVDDSIFVMILQKKAKLDVLRSTIEAHLLHKGCCRCAISQYSDASDASQWSSRDRMLVRDEESLDANVLMDLFQKLPDEDGISNS